MRISFEKRILIALGTALIFGLCILNIAISYFFITTKYTCPDGKWLDIKDMIWGLAPWELLLMVGVIYPFYMLLSRYIEERKRHADLMEILLVAISHKMGNFLSTQRVNMEILRDEWDDRMLDKLVEGNKRLEEDLNKLTETINVLGRRCEKEEIIDLSEAIDDVMSQLKDGMENKRLIVRVKKAEIDGVGCGILRNVLYTVLENAVKYSSTCVHIRLFEGKRRYFLAVRNDIAIGAEEGSGLGLYIAERLGAIYGVELMHRAKRRHYLIILSVSKGR